MHHHEELAFGERLVSIWIDETPDFGAHLFRLLRLLHNLLHLFVAHRAIPVFVKMYEYLAVALNVLRQ